MEFIKESVGPIYSIPSYEEAVEMCNKPDAAFYETKLKVDGFTVSIFNYRLAQFSDFNLPLEDKPEVKAFEMRGLTFVFNKDGSLYKRFVLLEKFFNLNQVPNSMYSVVKDYKIRYINNKEDGSIASFIQLPNGKIVGRSKMGFDNDQANGINKIYKTNKDVNSFVDWALNNDIVPIFEYVAPHNRIVLRYSQEELILLRLRDNKTGKHIDIKDHLDKIGSIKIAPFEDDDTLDGLIEKSKTEAEKEGWIVQFDNDHMVKIKTDWYRNLHSVYTNDLYHEDKLIKLIIDEKIDDIICELKEDDHLRRRVDEIVSIIKKCVREKIDRIHGLYNVYKKLNSIKEFAISYYNNEDFSDTMKYIRNSDISLEDLAKDWILKKTNRLEKAREFIENNKTIQ
jgi:T4 RnlA family RNA ligase